MEDSQIGAAGASECPDRWIPREECAFDADPAAEAAAAAWEVIVAGAESGAMVVIELRWERSEMWSAYELPPVAAVWGITLAVEA